MSQVNLGELAQKVGERDAVHVAVIASTAEEIMYPAQRVELRGDIVGIVDPFLQHPVPKGGCYWLFLLPNTVTGMRHHWQHPAFTTAPVMSDKQAAEKWLLEQCEPLGCEFDDLVGEESYLVSGEWIRTRENESARDHWNEIEDEFWKQRRIYTGQEVPVEKRGGFTCSC